VSWGDPFDKFYKDDGDDSCDRRRHAIVKHNLVPGTMVLYGVIKDGMAQYDVKTLHVWSGPSLQSDTYSVTSGLGTIISVDCESDPTIDWLFLLLNASARTLFCWVPTDMVRRIE
jgi:hypothetical protein